MYKNIIILILSAILILPFASGCKEEGYVDEELESIDMEKALLYTPSKHIRLFDDEYMLRNPGDRRYVNMNYAFYSGYEIRESIFMHPSSEIEYVMADYQVDLSEVVQGSLILLEYGAGIADGVQADGVDFAVFINDEKMASDVTKGGGWVDKIIDLSSFAGQSIKITLGTRGEPSTKYAWAAFSNPVVNIIEDPTNHLLIGEGKEIETNVSGEIKLENNRYDVNGQTIIESTDFTDGDGYIVVSGTGNPDIKSYIGNRRAKIIKLDSEGETYKYLISFDAAVTKRDDWDVALGLPVSEIDLKEFDYTPPYERTFSIELDSENSYSIDSVNLWRKPGIIESKNFTSGAYREYNSNETSISIMYKNTGSGAILRDDGFALRAEYTDTDGKIKKLPGFRIPEMARYTEYLKTVNAGKLEPGEYNFRLYLIDSRGETLIDESNINVLDNDISLESSNQENVFIENDSLKLLIVQNNGEYNEAYLYEKKTGRLAGTFALPRLVTSESEEIISTYKIEEKENDSIKLSSETSYGVIEISYELTENRINSKHEFTASRDFGLKAFDGPHFLTGNQSFGSAHDNAIFAGIDYLSIEPSNNDLSTARMYADRFVPDTRKVTAPVMAVANNGIVIKYTWDKNVEWITDRSIPPARFESPALDGSQYGIMGIFAPSGTQYINENELVANKEYPVNAKEKIVLESSIELLYEDDSIAAFVKYLQDEGIPELPELNKEPIDVFKAMVKGLDSELIGDKGWIGFIGVDTEPRVQTGLLHTLIGAQHLLSEEERDIAKRLLNTVSVPTPALDWSYADSIYWRMERDFIDEYYSTSKGRINSHISSQSDSGTWSFNPSNKKDTLFGRPGDITMGTVAVPTLNLIKGAKLTGDEEALESAYKGVRALAEFTKPAGAGPWELANSQPDLLAVVLGAKAALDLYDYTGDEEILEIAVKIAKQGLPFIYFTEVPRKSESLYGTVPSFGSTNWHRPWQGSPVQWQGMFLSDVYKRLADYDETLDWAKIGQGMANVGINLVNDERWPGRFPDFLDLYKSEPTIYNIWGELAASRVYESLGYINSWDFGKTEDFSVISGYEITQISQSEGTILFETKVPENMPGYILIHAEKISEISVNGESIDEYDTALTNTSFGFRKMLKEDAYVVKVRGNKEPLKIVVRTES